MAWPAVSILVVVVSSVYNFVIIVLLSFVALVPYAFCMGTVLFLVITFFWSFCDQFVPGCRWRWFVAKHAVRRLRVFKKKCFLNMKDHEEQICRVHTCTYFKVCALQDLWDISLVFWGTISAVNQPLCMEHVFWWIKCLPVLSLIKKKARKENGFVLYFFYFFVY